jgi:tRNA uridine 5-carboxymethylaminomethyl modification enzyme
LFLAGQINGTSGYEDAAAKGFVAGINAAHSVLGRDEFVLGRDQAYIGVLIDDLVTKGTREPYRMFTSRAEHRLVLREDNAIDRLGSVGNQLGLMGEDAKARLEKLKNDRGSLLQRLRETKIFPTADVQTKLASIPTPVLGKSISFEGLLRRAELDCSHLSLLGFDTELDPNICEPVEIEVKYAGYVKRQMDLISQSKKMEDLLLGDDLNYREIRGLSHEEIEKLSRIKPRTLGQAQRISGVNPSAVQAIMIYLKGQRKVPSEFREERIRLDNGSLEN